MIPYETKDYRHTSVYCHSGPTSSPTSSLYFCIEYAAFIFCIEGTDYLLYLITVSVPTGRQGRLMVCDSQGVCECDDIWKGCGMHTSRRR